MKKILLALALVFSANLAAISNSAPSGNAFVPTVNGYGRWPVYSVDPSGTPLPTPAAGGSNVTLNGISGAAATSYYDKLTASAVAGSTAAGQASLLTVQQGAAGSLTLVATALGAYPHSAYIYGGAGQPASSTVRTISTAVTQIQITRTAGSDNPTNVYAGATPTAGTILYAFTNTGVTPTSDAFYWSYTNGTTPITPQPCTGATILWLKTATGTYDMHLEFWQ